jgi:hypothetical protein
MGSPAGVGVLVVWLKTGDVAQIQARETRRMTIVLFFITVLLFQSFKKYDPGEVISELPS